MTADKSPDAFRTISEVAAELEVPQHVLRFWETKFAQIRPIKRAGGRRYYRPEDVALLKGIRRLLYGEGFTIRGAQRVLKEKGARAVAVLGDPETPIGPLAAPPEDEPAIRAPASSTARMAAAEAQSAALPQATRRALQHLLGDLMDLKRILDDCR